MTLRLSSVVTCCGLVLLLAACAGTPSRAPVAVDLPEVWRAPLPHDGSTVALADWWRAFPDPMLVKLIERAQAANPDLQMAAARHRQARALVKQARADLLPQLGVSATSSRGKNLNNVGGVSTQSDTQFNASWEIDLFGGQRAAADEQAARAVAAQHDWHAARVTLAADVAAAYVNLRLAQAREEVAELDGLLAAQLAAWGRQQQAAGLLNASDVALLHTDASLAAARRSTERAEAQVALQELALLLAVQAAPLAAELQAPALPAGWASPRRALPGVPAFAVHALPAQLLAQRPDVAAAHQRWLAALAHHRSVDAQRYPQLSLGALVGEARLRVGGGSSVSSFWSIGPSLTLPLFDGGARRAQGQAALAAADEAAAALQAKWQTAVAEVEESLERMVATRDRGREVESVAREWQGIAHRAALQAQAGLHSGPLRAQPRPVTRLNRRTLAILVGGLAVAVLGATIWSLQPQRRSADEQTELYNVDRVSKSEGLDGLPADYSKLPPQVPELGPPLPGDLGPAIVNSQQPAVAAYAAPGHDPNDALRKEAEAAAASSVFFRSGDSQERAIEADMMASQSNGIHRTRSPRLRVLHSGCRYTSWAMMTRQARRSPAIQHDAVRCGFLPRRSYVAPSRRSRGSAKRRRKELTYCPICGFKPYVLCTQDLTPALFCRRRRQRLATECKNAMMPGFLRRNNNAGAQCFPPRYCRNSWVEWSLI